jgi:hypothetical protein
MMFAFVSALIVSAFAVSLPNLESNVQAKPLSEPAPFGDACRNVSFKFTNEHRSGGQIRFQRIKYYNQANGQWQTEDVPNTTCPQGSTCVTNGNNLRDSEGENLTKFRLVYKYKPASAGANWSDEVETGDLIPGNAQCRANKTYGPGSDGWVVR